MSEATAHGELVINALNGGVSLNALTALALQLKGKDLIDISSARGTEMLLPIWLRLWGALQKPNFNFKIVVG